MIISAPGTTGNGASCTRIVESLDSYPTLVGLCGLPKSRRETRTASERSVGEMGKDGLQNLERRRENYPRNGGAYGKSGVTPIMAIRSNAGR